MTKYVVLCSKPNWSYTSNCSYVIIDFVELESNDDILNYVKKTLTDIEEISNIDEDFLWMNCRELRTNRDVVYAKEVIIVEYGVNRFTYGFLKVEDINNSFI